MGCCIPLRAFILVGVWKRTNHGSSAGTCGAFSCSCFNSAAAYDHRTLLQAPSPAGEAWVCSLEIRSECTNITFSSFSSSCNNSFCVPSAPDVPVLNTALFTPKQVRTSELRCFFSCVLYLFLFTRIL